MTQETIPPKKRRGATNPALPVVHGGTGRPPYSDEVRERILRRIKIGGVPRSVAAQAEGVSKSVLSDWLKAFPEFANAVEAAEAFAHASVAQSLKRHTIRNPAAAVVWLERRFPDTWKQRVEITVEPTPEEEIADSDLTDEELEAFIARERGTRQGGRASAATPSGESGEPA